MTVKWHCSLMFLAIFLASVSGQPVCSLPYECLSTRECAERHAAQGTEEVLFMCEEKKKICCPPAKRSASVGPLHVDLNNYGTNQKKLEDCDEVPNQPNRQQTRNFDYSTRTEKCRRPTQNQNNQPEQPVTISYQSRRTTTPKPETRRPQQQTGRPPIVQKKPQSEQVTQNVHSSLTGHRNLRLLPTGANCGVNNFANRITEGEEVYLGEYPWMALTGLKDKYGNYRWNCGGTLINGWYVLTAAHCLSVDNRTIEFVRLGEHSLSNRTDCNKDICLDPPVDVAIAEVIPHEKWNTTTIKNDIALLRLSKNALELGSANIYPICLPIDTDKLNITSSTKYEVAGWGKTDWNADEGSDVLRKASISGVSREECNICKDKKKQQYCPIIDTQLCVQGWKSVDVCKGDSGGPLMVTRLNIYQIGITSFKGSEYCGAENIPSIFTKVESYMPWILNNLRK